MPKNNKTRPTDPLSRPLTAAFQFSGNHDELIIPYGMIRHGKVFLDINRAAAERIVRMFEHPQRHTDESPFYIGHPDEEEWTDMFRDHSAYGWIERLTAEDDGLHLHMNWNEEGRALIASDKFRYWSPRFAYMPANRRHESVPVVEPFLLVSAGFTHEPAIPHLSLACQASDLEAILTKEQNMTLLEKLRAKFNLSSKADEASVETEVNKLETLACQANDRAVAAESRALVAEGKIAALETERDTAQQAATLACQQARAAHLSAGKSLLTIACQDMRVLPAQEEEWNAKFDTEDPEAFTLACQQLRDLKPTVKTDTEVGDELAKRKAKGLTDRETVKTLVCQERKRLETEAGYDPSRSYEAAWENVKAANPTLPM